MFLSIIIPVWNDEKYLNECLDSCLRQDIPYDDYEIICVDDGSTDATPEILADYKKRFQNVIIINKKHGVDSGRNIGMEHAKGEYLWFVDHDDMIAENCLQALKRGIADSGCERLVFHAYQFFGELSAEERAKIDNNTLIPNAGTLRDAVVWTSIIHRRFLQDNNIWPRSKRLNGKKGWSTDSFYVYELKRAGVKETRIDSLIAYYYRKHPLAQTNNYRDFPYLSRISGEINYALLVKEDYASDLKESNDRLPFSATSSVAWSRACAMLIAPAPWKAYKEGVKMLREAGLFVHKIPTECTYSLSDCIKSKNDMGLFKSIAYYYSATRIGIFFYRLSFAKVFISSSMRKSKLLNRLLDLKNKIVRR